MYNHYSPCLRARSYITLVTSVAQLINPRRQLTSVPHRRRTFYLFIGGPGVGKGTFAQEICKTESIDHFSIGDTIRKEIKARSSLGLQCEQLVESGSLVPDSLVNEIAAQHLRSSDRDVILDGYPRTVEQAVHLARLFPSSKASVVAVNISLDREVATEKLLQRVICSNCGAGFNTAHIVRDGFDMPAMLPNEQSCRHPLGYEGHCLYSPAAMSLSGMFVRRSDDDRGTILRRFAEFDRKTVPLLDFFRQRNQLIDFHVTKGIKDTPALIAKMRGTADFKT